MKKLEKVEIVYGFIMVACIIFIVLSPLFWILCSFIVFLKVLLSSLFILLISISFLKLTKKALLKLPDSKDK